VADNIHLISDNKRKQLDGDDFHRGMLEAVLLSDYARDPEHPEKPPSYEQYFCSVCKHHPQEFFRVLMRQVEREKATP
jgi:hypothetical protein